MTTKVPTYTERAMQQAVSWAVEQLREGESRDYVADVLYIAVSTVAGEF